MEILSDNALMLKVKSGDLDKLGLLYERYKKILFGFFYNMNNDAVVCEDLVQNVFMRILKYKHTYSGEGKFSTWMYHLARNVSHDHYRKNKRTFANEDISGFENKVKDHNSFDAQLNHEEDVSILKLALSKLNHEKREVLVLSRYEELKYQEIAKVLGCSEGAVKVKVHRALKDLKEIYSKIEKGGSHELR